MTVNDAETHSTATASTVTGELDARLGMALDQALAAHRQTAKAAPDPAPADTWAIGPLEAALACRQIELILPPDARALEGIHGVDGVLIDASSLSVASAAVRQEALQAGLTFAQDAPEDCLISYAPRAPVAGATLEEGLQDSLRWVISLQQCAPGRVPLLEWGGAEDGQAAAAWAAALSAAEKALGLPHGRIRLSLRVDTAAAVGELDALLWALRERVVATRLVEVGVFCDLLRQSATLQAPRADILTAEAPALDALSKALTVGSHRRGVLSLSSALPMLPIHDDPEAMHTVSSTVGALAQGRLRNGHDGVALVHSAFVDLVRAEAQTLMPTPNQLERPLDWAVTPALWHSPGPVEIGEAGLRNNVCIALQVIESGLSGQGRLALYNQIEDLHSGALCWMQLWHWLRHAAALADGRQIDADLFEQVLHEELDIIRVERDPERIAHGHFEHAAALLQRLCLGDAPPVLPFSHLSQGTDRK